ncbi:hypothetical protein [Candidatus Nitrospira salsa]
MTHAIKEQKQQKGGAALISMTRHELLSVCSIAKGNEFLYAIPLSKIVDMVLEHSIGMVETWEFVDLSIENSGVNQFRFDDWFNYPDSGFEEMTLSLRFKNLEHGRIDSLEVDMIQVIRNELQAISSKLYIGGAEISEGKKKLVFNGREISLKDGEVRVLITTHKPQY